MKLILSGLRLDVGVYRNNLCDDVDSQKKVIALVVAKIKGDFRSLYYQKKKSTKFQIASHESFVSSPFQNYRFSPFSFVCVISPLNTDDELA